MSKFLKATGRELTEWRALLEDHLGSASEVPHQEMARFVVSQGVSDWWAQSLAVALEQEIGRRVVGQTCAGTFSANASKTIAGDWLALFDAWCSFALQWPEASTSATEKWRYWRTPWPDGSKVVVTCQSRTPGKVTFAVNHDGLADNVSRETMKTFRREKLAEFAAGC
ncbi:hypothetical protein [Corynebacterium epidermidicanis]|uniref:Uncharacterized protein n=1 Tax=Corynebacterium epidermidicanis TaxID=1050174 RepID=A0A0G3GT83_9CORY|nr:hypothetical protein [Corynebacterium epidermidicanis]AKK04334.1 hypothetical protein CEPID_12560 [Corynebacterium epidermidicanis]